MLPDMMDDTSLQRGISNFLIWLHDSLPQSVTEVIDTAIWEVWGVELVNIRAVIQARLSHFGSPLRITDTTYNQVEELIFFNGTPPKS